MSTVFHLDVEILPGGKHLRDKIAGMAKRARNFGPAFMAIGESLAVTEKHRLAHEGPGWAPLAKSTLQFKRRYGYTTKILGKRTGVLEQGLTTGLLHHAQYLPHTAIWRVNVPYAKYHQFGNRFPPNKERLLIDLTPRVVEEWLTIMREYLLFGKAITLRSDVGVLR